MARRVGDNTTNITSPGFVGTAEADSIVRHYADGDPISEMMIDASDAFNGETVAIPLDGNQAFPNGQYMMMSLHELNDPNFFLLDGTRQIGATAEDVAGNLSDPGFLDIFLDTRGPRVADVFVTDAPDYELFDPKPSSDGPTPLINEITVKFIDLPTRTDDFSYAALNEVLATTIGNYELIGDHVGPILIQEVLFEDLPMTDNGEVPVAATVGGSGTVIIDGGAGQIVTLGLATGLNDIGLQPRMTLVTLVFAEPLPDDRFTLRVRDSISDDVGNALDGESQAASPFDESTQQATIFPSGDGGPGSDFVARFTVDTRAEIGTYAFESVFIDTNGNFVFDPEGQDNDQTNRDLAYQFGFTTDARFAGNFAGQVDNGPFADGFDKLALYGFSNGNWRWEIDTDNDGVADIIQTNPLALQGFPFAGNFTDAHPGDEVGLFTGTEWYLDINGDFRIDNTDIAGFGTVFDDGAVPHVIPGFIGGGNMRGFPIVGDFDGDGTDDLGSQIRSLARHRYCRPDRWP